jgi:putative transposase
VDRCHPARLKPSDYRGAGEYFLTFCAASRREPFTSAENVALVMGDFQRAARQESAAILAWCFMPDHVHLLVELQREPADLRRLVCRMKQYSGYGFKRRCGTDLWQRSYFDRTMRDDVDVYFTLRYILDNPVRAGLVKSICEYPFLGTTMMTLEEVEEDLRMYPPGI